MPDALHARSTRELAENIASGAVSAVELVDHHLARIEALNGDLNAVVTLDADGARLAARAADAALASGEPVGPLHGVPCTIKDALATGGMRTTGGAVELADNVPTADAPVVARLRAAGAIVMGKTNLPRWSGDVQATNEIFGTTGNPWDTSRTPGGSSGGASAAISAQLTPFDIGTDIGGSVRLPAHFAGVCGHKPSFGVVPAHGYIDHPTAGLTEPDINVIGPLARTVDDLELLFDVIAGPNDADAVGWRLDLPPARDGARVAAWLDDPACPVATDVGALLDGATAALESAGTEVDRSTRPDLSFDVVRETGLPLIAAATSPGRTDEEFDRFRAAALDPGSVDPVMAVRARASAMFHRDWLLLTEERERIRRVWAELFEDVDVLLCPVAVVPAFPHVLDGNIYTRTLVVDGSERPYVDLLCWTSLVGMAYLPSTVVPVGLTPDGLPVGIQVVGPYLGDRTTLAVARLVEAVTGGYRPPPIASAGGPR